MQKIPTSGFRFDHESSKIDGSEKKCKSIEETYKVNLTIPSLMKDPEILVDGEPAIIIDQRLTQITIRVEKKELPHKITLKKGNSIFTKEVLIDQNNLSLELCR